LVQGKRWGKRERKFGWDGHGREEGVRPYSLRKKRKGTLGIRRKRGGESLAVGKKGKVNPLWARIVKKEKAPFPISRNGEKKGQMTLAAERGVGKSKLAILL